MLIQSKQQCLETGSKAGLLWSGVSRAWCDGAEQEARCTQASHAPCQLSPWPPARGVFSPPGRLLCPCGLGASRFQISNVIIILLRADFCPVSPVTQCKEKSETHLSIRTSQPPAILTSKNNNWYVYMLHPDMHRQVSLNTGTEEEIVIMWWFIKGRCKVTGFSKSFRQHSLGNDDTDPAFTVHSLMVSITLLLVKLKS